MKKLAITLITIVSLCSANLSYSADEYFTVTMTGNPGHFSSAPYKDILTVPAGKICHILNFIQVNTTADVSSSHDGELVVVKNGISFMVQKKASATPPGTYALTPGFFIVGPATVQMSSHQNDAGILTYKLSPSKNINGVGQ